MISDREFNKILKQDERERDERKEKRKQKQVKRMSDGFRLLGKKGEWQDIGDDIKSGEEVRVADI